MDKLLLQTIIKTQFNQRLKENKFHFQEQLLVLVNLMLSKLKFIQILVSLKVEGEIK